MRSGFKDYEIFRIWLNLFAVRLRQPCYPVIIKSLNL